MKRKKIRQSIVAMMLAVITLISTITVAAEPLSEEQTFEEIVSEERSSEEAEIIEECTELREENLKQFRMSDGTIQAAYYSEPVHFEQNGEWIDYDNTLTETDADDDVSQKKTNDKDLTNHTADYSVRLSKKTNGKKFVRLEKDGYKISWYYTNANKRTAKVIENKEDSDQATLEKLTSAVIYEDVYKNTDFEYIIGSNGIKENIILKKTNAPDEFTSVYQSNGLIPVQTDDKTVELRTEDNEVVYIITAPYMIDANGECSDGITLTLAETKNNTFTLKIQLNKEWLQSDERKYPITVDPMLKTQQKTSSTQSAFVASQYPNKCYRTASTNDMGSLYVGNIYGYGQTESYIKFTDLPKLGIADKVVDARLNVGLMKCELGLTVDVKRLIENWDQDKVTWNNGPHGENRITDYKVLTETTATDKFCEFEITDIVRGWYSGEYPNYGVSLSTTKTASAKAWFYSTYYTTYYQNRPIMLISYRNMTGYEDYWSYTNITAGRGGTVSVNNYNGNLIYTQPITQDNGGNLMPVDLSVIYNSNQSTVLYSNLGNSVQTNYHIFIKQESGELWNNGYKYYLNDADGTKHWFYFANNSETNGKDEDGLGYSLKVITVGSDKDVPTAKYIVTDKESNKMYFDSSGCINQITSAANISSKVTYETVSSVRRIKQIIDGAGRAYTFTYDPDYPKLITAITDPAGRKTSFLSPYWKFSKILFADGEKVELSYNSSDLVQQITGIDGTRTKINYDSSSQKRVSSINWGTSDSNLLEKYSFSYKQNETTITDLQNRSYTYQFNDFGQTTGTVSNTDGSAQFFEYSGGNSTSNKANKLLSESRVLKTTTNYVKNPGFTRGYEGFWTYTNDSAGASVTIDSSKYNLTKNSVKVSKTASNTGRVNAVQTVSNLPAGTYTLSAYINTNGAEIPGDGVQMFAEILDSNITYISHENIEKTTKTNGWERRSVTFTVPSGGTVRATMGFGPNASGTVWFDDIQLEKSAGASSCNLVENSAFINGLTGWKTFDSNEITTTYAGLSGFSNCAKLTGSIENKNKIIKQYIYAPGKKNDVFSVGMWAYAFSAPINKTKDNDSYKPDFDLLFEYYDANGKWLGALRKPFNADVKDKWQFLAAKFIVPADYTSIAVSLSYNHNVNAAYQTGAFCFKEQYGQTYDYDSDGNVKSVVDLAKTNSGFSYYGNQMAKMLNPSGSKYMYTYNNKKQPYYALSSDGLEYYFAYDNNGNVTKSETRSRKPATQIESGKKYLIVNAYSGFSINCGDTGNRGDDALTRRYSSATATQYWEAKAVSGTTDVYEFVSAEYPSMTLDVRSGSKDNGAYLQLYTINHAVKAQKFKLVKQSDGTFGIFTGTTDYAKCLDAQYDSQEIATTGKIRQNSCTKTALKESQKWYFYPVEKTEEKMIITEATYTDSGNFLKTLKDEVGAVTNYSYDEKKGTLQSVTDASGNATSYTYNEKNNVLTSVTAGGMKNSYSYSKDRLTAINVNGSVKYSFTYDAFGRTTANKVGNGTDWKTLSSMQYNNAGLMSKQTYGNGNYYDFTYDSLDRITQKRYNGDNSKRVTYSYGNNGNIAQITDYYTNTNTRFVYDLADRIVSQREYTGTKTSGGTLRSSTDYTYANKTNYLTGVKHFSPLGTQTIGYRYGNLSNGQMPDCIYGVTWNGKEKVSYMYDGLGRLTDKKTGSFSTTYSYPDIGATRTTTRLRSITTPAGTYTYNYDNIGNIKTADDGTYKTSYVYDELNQLVRVNDQRAGKSYTYTYKNGNITSAKEYAYTAGELGEALSTKTWNYTDTVWKDLLTDCNGEAITYDTIGNPLTIGSKEFSWNGRQLAQLTNGDNTTVYAYNGDGQRISKTVNGTKTEYYYNGSILAGEKTGNNTIIFMYDNNGDAFGFTYNGKEYYYIKNAQNDVTAIADSSGKVVANYHYDAWGKLLEVTGTNTDIANANPIRYRSYYYDSDTELYYLNTRYYSPDMCRFINADSYIQTGQDILDKNTFAYCGNNPVMRADDGGEIWHIVVGAVVGAAIGAVSEAISQKVSGEEINWAAIGISAASGAISGGLACTGVGLGLTIAANTAISAAESALKQGFETNFTKISIKEVVIDGVVGGVTAAIGGKGSGSKRLTNLGKNTIKRTINAGTHHGLKVYGKEAIKATSYYVKNTFNSFYKSYFWGVAKDVIVDTAFSATRYGINRIRSIRGGI